MNNKEMAIHFENAKRLYHQKLLPLLEKQHGRKEDLESLPFDDPKRSQVQNNWAIVKPSIGELSTEQQALCQEIFKGLCSEEGYERFTK